jgi:hypothetical protein
MDGDKRDVLLVDGEVRQLIKKSDLWGNRT